jgi:hypothetical protein
MAFYAPGTLIPSKLYLIQAQSAQSAIFRFLDLPGEIRNKIYDLVFDECLIEVRSSNQQQYHDRFNDGAAVGQQRQPYNQYDTKSQPEIRVGEGKWPHHKNLQTQANLEPKPRKQTPVLLQEQARSVGPQKHSKPQQGRRNEGRDRYKPSKMYHDVLSLAHLEGGNSTGYRIPFSFMLTCCQIHNEALCVMYAKIGFRFTSTKTIERFLSTTPLRALQVIRGLDINHATQAEPELTKHRRQKLASDKKWSTMCKQMCDKMTDLKTLRLTLAINDWPIQLSLREEWAQPLLCLRQNGLDRVDATIVHSAFSDARLNEAARNLEFAMMNDKGRMDRTLREKKLLEEKKKKAETKARKVLVIKMVNIPKAPKVQE